MSETYLIGSWVAFVQQIQHLVVRGYVEYCLVNYPEDKEDKFLKIDQKLINKYNCNQNKDKTYYNKQKNYSSFKFLRFGNTGIFLKTNGNLKKGIVMDDKFQKVKKTKIPVTIGPKAVLLIGYNDEKKVTVFLDNDSYREARATCLEYMDRKNYKKMVETFNALNGLPAWGGINEQKIRMKEYLLKRLRKKLTKEQVWMYSKQMRINTKRTAVKVF